MAFALTVLYLVLTLLSPAVFPPEMVAWHLPAIVGVLAILASIPKAVTGKLGSLLDTYLALGLTISVVLSIVISLRWIGGAITALGLFTPVIFSFFFVLVNCRSLLRIQILAYALLFVAVFIFTQGMHAFLAGNFTSPYLLNEHDLYRFRGLGVIADPNDYAQCLVLLTPLLWLRWTSGKYVGNLMLTLLPAAFLVMAIFFTHSRGAFVALAAALLFGFKDKLGRIKSALLVTVAIVAIIGVDVGGGRAMTDDDGGRVSLWMAAMSAFETRPLFGIGMGSTRDYTDTHQTAHNSYILAMAELGVVGDFFWLGLLTSSWISLSQISRPWRQRGRLSNVRVLSALDRIHSKLPIAIGRNPDAQWPSNGFVSVQNVGYGITSPSNKDQSKAMTAAKSSLWFAQAERKVSADVDIPYAAHVIRTSLVGTLTACFFLSRAFSVVLYVILGLAAGLCAMYKEAHPSEAVRWSYILKRTAIVTFGSILGLYLFLRLMGALGVR